ncbi:MAG: FAD:protein FMN transferase [Anaerolineaceae bacterium]|nr:FAD:protein FMN transferase [Anaerolineaceae bacterium]
MKSKSFRAMGCQMSAFIDSPSNSAQETLALVPEWFEIWEQALSRFRADSELSTINRLSGIPSTVSEVFWSVLTLAIQTEQESMGLVTPLVLPALEMAGYNVSFEQITGAEYGTTEYSGYPIGRLNDLIFDANQRIIQLPLGSGLDFGGVAKGWAANQAVERIAALGPALVNAGGDIAISDYQRGGKPWVIGVIDPFQPERDLGTISVGQSGVATSGRDFRQWRQNGVFRHHIIDPCTGMPADTDLVSVTVIAQDVMAAEMAAKIVMLKGSQAGLDWLENETDYQAILVLADAQILTTEQIATTQWRQNDNNEIAN